MELFTKEVDLGSHGGIDIVLEFGVVDEMGGSLYGEGNVLGLIGAVGIIFPELDVADDGSKFLGRFREQIFVLCQGISNRRIQMRQKVKYPMCSFG